MPIDTSVPESPGWWLQRLLRKLADRRDHYDHLEAYYDGTNVIPVHADKACSEAYRRLMRVSKTNFAELVVEAVRERMQPVGFRTGAPDDELGDAAAWQIWQGNSLDADSAQVHAASLSMGMAYVIVGTSIDDELGVPLITPEDPREVIVETDPARRRRVLAGVKAFRDEVAGVDRAYLYLPGEVWHATREAHANGAISADVGGWEWEGEPATHSGPPRVVPFPNRPKIGRMLTRGEYETHLTTLDRINYTILQRVEIATLQAFRQRAILVDPDDMPDIDDDGDDIDYSDVFEQSPGALWKLPATAKLWESGQVDLGPVRQAIRDDIQDLAAVTRTPLYYLTADINNGSAEGAALAREGLLFKVWDRIAEAGEAWEKVMSLAFRAMDDMERADRSKMEVIWRSPERRSLSEMADAATKGMSGGLTTRAVRRDVWGKTPQEIEEMEADDMAEGLRLAGIELAREVVGGSDSAVDSSAS